MGAVENALHDLLDVVSGRKAHLSPSEADAHHAALDEPAHQEQEQAEQEPESPDPSPGSAGGE